MIEANTVKVFNVHQYLDSDFTGTHTECAANNVDAFNQLADWLRTNGRKAMVTETGGGNTASCAAMFCQQLDAIK
jgi:endoglucanase